MRPVAADPAPMTSGFDRQPEDSARLAERAARGDREAVELLIERHLPELRADTLLTTVKREIDRG